MDNQQGGNAGGQQEDYMDKGLDAVEKKFGQGKIDPAKERGTNEKITDGIRGGLNKFIPESKKLPSKFSN